MSISYTLGGKSQTYQRGKKEGKSAVSTPLNRGKSQPSTSTGLGQADRTGNANFARVHPTGEAGTRRRPQKTATNAKTGAKTEFDKQKTGANFAPSQRQSNIVTLSDLKTTEVNNIDKGKSLSRKETNFQTSVAGVGRTSAKSDSPKSKLHHSSEPSSQSGVSGRRIGLQSNASLVSRTNTDSARTLAHEYANVGSSGNIATGSQRNWHSQSYRQVPTKPLANKSPSKTAVKPKGGTPSKKGRGGNMASPGYGSNRMYSSNARQLGQRSSQDQDVSDPSSQGQGPPQQQQEQAAQHDGSAGYTRITPNESKRQQLTNQASKELAEYEKRLAARRQIRIEGPAQTTGGLKSEEDARREMERINKTKKYEKIMKREKYLKEKRERDEQEHVEKKARAREQTEKNKRLQAEREDNFLRDEHERTNEVFLRRLEASIRAPQGSSSSASEELQMLIEMFPRKEPAKLQEMLALTGGDVNKVIDLLQ